MPEQFELPPSAASLTASLRDLGYSLATAVADLIDNSITAKATRVDLVYTEYHNAPCFALIDDGEGMSRDELITAMKLGSMHASARREPNDLGRFGLGLKTASFSQCRRLTVFSMTGGIMSGACWDLDVIEERDSWVLQVLDEDEIRAQPFVERICEGGTVVLWQKLDRLLEAQVSSPDNIHVYQKLEQVGRHLALVFHRFLVTEHAQSTKLTLTLNGHTIEPLDPFCRRNPATQLLPEERITLHGEQIRIQPYILPHHSRLTPRDRRFYEEHSSFLNNQGVYVYRNRRLMAWGDWFRLIQKSEATKLARIQIDFPNSLDEAWTIDIKKSRATPPSVVRDYVRNLLPKITTRSLNIHRKRGQMLHDNHTTPVWRRQASEQGVRYLVNQEHPLVETLSKQLTPSQTAHLHTLCDTIGSALPLELLYSDCADNPENIVTTPPESSQPPLKARLIALHEAVGGDLVRNSGHFLNIIHSTRLFSEDDDTLLKLIDEILP